MRVTLLLTVCLAVAGCQRSAHCLPVRRRPRRRGRRMRFARSSVPRRRPTLLLPTGRGLEITPHDWTGGRARGAAPIQGGLHSVPSEGDAGEDQGDPVTRNDSVRSSVSRSMPRGRRIPMRSGWLWHWFNGEEWRTGKIDAPAKVFVRRCTTTGGTICGPCLRSFGKTGRSSGTERAIYDNPCMSIASDEGDGGWFHPAADLLDPKAPKSSPLAMPEAPRGRESASGCGFVRGPRSCSDRSQRGRGSCSLSTTWGRLQRR